MLAVGCALVLAGVSAAGNGGLLPPSPHSPNAHRITHAYYFILVFTGIIFLGVEGALITFVVKYRRGKRPRDLDGPQIHGSGRLEFLWTVLPVLILAAIGSFVFYELPGITNPPAASAADQTTITVQGQQFYWTFIYPNGAISIGRMVAPADEVVNENVVAPLTDVNHSWWVVGLGGKIDAIPGHPNKTWFKAPAGTYIARCGELCGIQHAKMIAHVEVVPRAEYEQFIASRKTPGMALGKETWKYVCMSCHRLDETFVGPELGDNPLLTDEAGLTTILRHGVGMMPAVGATWTKAQIHALVEYTKTLPKPGNGSNG